MVNSVVLVGRLVSNPEIKELSDEKKVINISLAIQRNFKNVNGEYDVDFIRCTMWNGIADSVNEYCHKGDIISIKGRLQSNNYEDKEGNKKYSLEVMVDRVAFISPKKETDVDITE